MAPVGSSVVGSQEELSLDDMYAEQMDDSPVERGVEAEQKEDGEGEESENEDEEDGEGEESEEGGGGRRTRIWLKMKKRKRMPLQPLQVLLANALSVIRPRSSARRMMKNSKEQQATISAHPRSSQRHPGPGNHPH